MTNRDDEQFCVFLHDGLIGRIHRVGDVTRFAFEDSYWGDADRAVLGLRFEDNPRERNRSRMRLPPWFSNLLPEGRLRQWIADARHVSVQREMELLAQVGHDLPGAVRVVAADVPVPVDTSGADESGGRVPKRADGLWSFSLAGVGLKFSLMARGERLTIPAVGEQGDWIVKLPDPVHPNVPRNEFAMMTLARLVGIEVPDIRLVHRDQVDRLPEVAWSSHEDYSYAIKRFDRTPDRRSIHIEDMAQVRGFYPEEKYSGSFETIAALTYRNHDVDSLREFARRMAFNVLIGNGDAHLKNWSLIYDNPRVPRLAPAYDLVSTFSYRPENDGVEDMGLRFGRSKRFEDVSLATFEVLDRRLSAKADLADVARTVAERVSSEWPEAEVLLDATPTLRRRIGLFVKSRLPQFLGA
ncbi:type II toxin-antitoxin system HipA family toxin [Azospirillum argentinense]